MSHPTRRATDNRVTDPALRGDLDALVAILRDQRPLTRDEWPS